jgi:hypothetical protein
VRNERESALVPGFFESLTASLTMINTIEEPWHRHLTGADPMPVDPKLFAWFAAIQTAICLGQMPCGQSPSDDHDWEGDDPATEVEHADEPDSDSEWRLPNVLLHEFSSFPVDPHVRSSILTRLYLLRQLSGRDGANRDSLTPVWGDLLSPSDAVVGACALARIDRTTSCYQFDMADLLLRASQYARTDG